MEDVEPVFAHQGDPRPHVFEVVDGQLPAGLSLCKKSGVISGTPHSSGLALQEFSVCIQVKNVVGACRFTGVIQVEMRSPPANLLYNTNRILVLHEKVALKPDFAPGIPSTMFRASNKLLDSGNDLKAIIQTSLEHPARACLRKFSTAISSLNSSLVSLKSVFLKVQKGQCQMKGLDNLSTNILNPNLTDLETEIKGIISRQEHAVLSENYEAAALLRDYRKAKEGEFETAKSFFEYFNLLCSCTQDLDINIGLASYNCNSCFGILLELKTNIALLTELLHKIVVEIKSSSLLLESLNWCQAIPEIKAAAEQVSILIKDTAAELPKIFALDSSQLVLTEVKQDLMVVSEQTRTTFQLFRNASAWSRTPLELQRLNKEMDLLLLFTAMENMLELTREVSVPFQAVDGAFELISSWVGKLLDKVSEVPPLPRGLELDKATGVISGAPSVLVPTCAITVTAFNDSGQTQCELVFSVMDQEAPSGLHYYALTAPTIFVVGEPCLLTPEFTSGQPAATFKICPNLPRGLIMDRESGIISGSPTEPSKQMTKFLIELKNSKGKCSFEFSAEVQLHIPPRQLEYQFFKYKSSCAHKLYPVFICNQILAPLYPTLEQGNYLWYQVQPALPDGIIIDPNTGVITGKPLQPTKSEIYTVSATNRKDSVQVKIAFATSNSCQCTDPSDWSVDQVQLWAKEVVCLDDAERVKLLPINGKGLLELRDGTALSTLLTDTSQAIMQLISLSIEKLVNSSAALNDAIKIPVNRPRVKSGDPASKEMLPIELRDEFDPRTVLGNGGFGVVIRAGRMVSGSCQYQVAIKVIYSEHQFSTKDTERMNREAKILGRIDSPYVVKLKSSGISKDLCQFWLVMDFLDGSSLRDLIEQKRNFSEEEVGSMAIHILSGLSALHKAGVTHCDVKPANIMQCVDSDDSLNYKLVDLGIAVSSFAAGPSLVTLNDSTMLRGTPGYICPEVIFKGSERIAPQADLYGPQADLYSLGATMFELLTGCLPYCKATGESTAIGLLLSVVVNMDEEPPDVCSMNRDSVSPLFATILKKALQKRRKDRYTTAEEMNEALRLCLAAQFEVPTYWSNVRWGQVVSIQLASQAAEYIEAAKLFTDSVKGATIVKIERIQNLGQWALYQVRKKEVSARGKPPNELLLFHGTDAETVPKIIRNSFNRSYCGKNATAYGQGVYFARSASYSASDTYSKPGSDGSKRMFLCRVCVGEYCVGSASMKVAPNKDVDAFDSTVDHEASPSLYVVYHDAQAYPEYLLTFRTR